MKSNKNIVYFFLFCCSTSFCFCQVKTDTLGLSEVLLQGSPIKNKLRNTASAVSVLTATDINKTDGIILTSVLNKIPGVLMQQATLSTNRITIRGIGSRSQFDTNRVKAYFNSIPLSSGDGETVIEDIDVLAIEKIEIIKGPNSTSFGSGLGGIIHLFTKEIATQESFGKSTTTFGSFGLLQQRLSAGYSNKNSKVYASYLDLQTEGFRANSNYARKSFNLYGSQKLYTKGTLSFLGAFTRLKANIPSSLNEKDFLNNPEKAAPTWAASQGYESYDKLLVGIGYDHQFSDKWSLKSSLFAKSKDEDRCRKPHYNFFIFFWRFFFIFSFLETKKTFFDI